MNILKIHTKNSAYQKFEVLKTNRNKRYKYNEFIVEGVRNINEAIKNNWQIVSFIYNRDIVLSDWAKNKLKSIKTDINYELTSTLMSDLSGKSNTSELLAIVKMRDDNISQLKPNKNPLVAVFDRPSNKGNLGTIIRSCDSFGLDGLIITGHTVDLYDPDVISASMGSFFNVQTIRIADNNTLFKYINTMKQKYNSMQVVGSTARKQTIITEVDFTIPTLLMIGNETDGLNHAFKECCDVLATIPMCVKSSATSFNVGCAATVFFYEAMRQRLIT